MQASRLPSFIVRWLPSLWLGFVVFRFGGVAFRTLHAAGDYDVDWAIGWMVFALAVTLTTLILPRSIVNRVWAIALGMTALAIILLTQNLLPVLAALFGLIVSAGFGEFLLNRLHLGPTGRIERLVLTIPIGLGFFALAELALAAVGMFTPVVVWVLVLACAVPAFGGLRKIAEYEMEARFSEHPLLIILFGSLCLLNLTWTTVPEIQFDANNVHLAVPKLYLHYGGLVDLPYFWNSYMAHLMSMVYAVGLVLGGVIAVKAIVFALGILAAGGVFVIGRRLFNEEVGIWAAMLFYSTPLVLWSSSTAYLDLAQSFFVAGSALAFFRWYETSHWAWLGVSGWIAGAAVGNKVAALSTLIVFPVTAAFLTVLRFFRRQPWVPSLKAVVAYTLLLILVCAPWYLVVYHYTGNPFFPLLNKVFRSSQWTPENTILDWDNFGIGTSLGALVRIPFRFTWETSSFGPFPRGSAGFTLLLILPLAAGYLWKGTLQQRVLLAAIVMHMTVWTYTAQYARYYIAVLPFVAILGCAIFLMRQTAAVRHVNRTLLLAGILVQQPVASALFVNIPERFPLAHAFGRESREEFLFRSLPGWRAVQYVNGIRKPDQKILGVGVAGLRFYFDTDVYADRYATLQTPSNEEFEKLRDELLQEGDRYIVASSWELEEQRLHLYAYMNPQFLQQFTERIFSDGSASVFQIKDP